MKLNITPKRRRKYLDPRNIKAWTDTFVRRDPNAPPMPLDAIIDRYLEDTKAGNLRDETESINSLRRSIAKEMLETWYVRTCDDDMVHGAQLLKFVRRAGKVWLTIPSGTILNTGSGFNHKELSAAGTLTAGTACQGFRIL